MQPGLWRNGLGGPKSPFGPSADGLRANECRNEGVVTRARCVDRASIARKLDVAPMSVSVSERKMIRSAYRSFETRRVIIFATGKKRGRVMRLLSPEKSAF
jgi:hypothetical protein